MPSPKLRVRPGVERLDARLVMSATVTVATSTSTALHAPSPLVPGS